VNLASWADGADVARIEPERTALASSSCTKGRVKDKKKMDG
jgi:hypothetical protein